MTAPDDLRTTLVRLEGKVDTLAVQVASGDKHGEQLVEIVRTQLGSLQQSMLDLRSQLSETAARASHDASAVRVDLERQLNEHKDVGKSITERIERNIDDLWKETGKHSTNIARLYGGLTLAGALGLGGFAALVKVAGG